MNPVRQGSGNRARRGFALLVVLWFLVLLATLGTYLLINARSETALARNMLANAHAEALGDAGITQAVFNLTGTDPTKIWPLDGTPHTVNVLGGSVTIRLYDEGAKINPNLASDTLLAALFEVLGLEPQKATRLGAAIFDWTHTGETPRPLGAKKKQYEEAGLNYGPPNEPAQSMDELQLVLGMTPDLFARAAPYLTIYANRPSPDPNTASGIVQKAITLAGTQALKAAMAGPGGPANAPPGAPQPPSPMPPGAPVGGPQTANAPPVTAAIEAVAHSVDGGTFFRYAVVRLDPKNPKGYVVLEWKRGVLTD